MQRIRHLALLASLVALSALGCSKAVPPAKPLETPAATAATATPSTPQPSPAVASDPKTDQAVSANVGDPAKFRAFLSTLQQAVQAHDAATVATLISFPIDINPHTKQLLRVTSPQAFVSQYNAIITPHITEVIANQKYNDLFVNYEGAMLGNGEVWIAGICKDKACTQTDIKIKTIQNTSGSKQ